MNYRDRQSGAMTRPSQGGLSRPQGMQPLARFDPWNEMEDMRRRMDAVFSRFFGFPMLDLWPRPADLMARGGQGGPTAAEPEVDIYENDNEYVLTAALPGVDQNDIQIEATENGIFLSAQCRSFFESQGQPSGMASNVQTQPSGASGQQTGTQGTQTATAQTGQPAGATSGQQAGANPPWYQAGATTGPQGGSQQSYTQHRQSRYANVNCFQFATTLPSEIKAEEVKANFRNGMLELHLPKRNPESNRRIPIQIQASGDGQGTQGRLEGQTAQGTTTGMAAGAQAGMTGQEHQARAGEASTASQPTPAPTETSTRQP